MGPVLCLVTDRRRFGAAWEPALVERVRAAARAGVHLVQVRERDLDGGPMARLTEQCVDAVRGTRARVLVNDRVDVALAAGFFILLPPLTSDRLLHVHENRLQCRGKCDHNFIMVKIGRNGVSRNSLV